MNVNTTKMVEYANFLEENSRNIIALCTSLEGKLSVAAHLMDSESGRAAGLRMAANIENIKKNVPISNDACKRLLLSKKYIDSARQVFGR